MCGTKSCAILGHSPMRFAWGFDEEAAECHDMKMELAQQIMVLRQHNCALKTTYLKTTKFINISLNKLITALDTVTYL